MSGADVRSRLVDAAGDLGARYADMWDLIVRAAHLEVDGMPSMQEVAVDVSYIFVRARSRYGHGECGLDALRWMLERLEKKVAMLRQLLKERELAEENDLPSVEELERIDWQLVQHEPGSPAWHGAVSAGGLMAPGEDEELPELDVETVTVRPTVRVQVENAPGRVRWIGLGFSVEMGTIVLFKGDEYAYG